MTPRRRQLLAAMGIDVWVDRASPDAVEDAPAAAEPAGAPAPQDPPAPVAPLSAPTSAPPVAAPAKSKAPRKPAPVRSPAPAAADGTVAAMSWAQLQAAVSGCEACPLHETRTQTVFGTGSEEARWMFVGEAPGAEEDRQGEPFVGRAGQLLNAMLTATSQERRSVYIANILKCRPPRNRDPSAAEVAQCSPYLTRQINIVAPKLLIALGRVAAQRLLQTDAPLGRLRGTVHEYDTGEQKIPLIVTYHPAYLLRSPREKAKAWEDLRRAMDLTG